MPLWKAAYIGVNQDHEKMLGQSQVCEKQSLFQAVLWVTNSSSEGGWGTLAQRNSAASDRSQHWDHIVRAEEKAKFSPRQTQHAKSHVGWNNSGILLADSYLMDFPSSSIVQYCPFRGAIPLHSHTLAPGESY